MPRAVPTRPESFYDTFENAVFDSYEPVFRLVKDFIERY